MTETEIARELMKGCAECGEDIHPLCYECQAKISTQLEANKMTLEFLEDLVNKNMEGEIDGNESKEIKKILDKCKDLQQAIKILEGKGEK